MADSDLAERYRFAPDDLAAVRAASRPDNWHGPLEAVVYGAWIAIWCAASVLTWRHAPWWLAVPVYVVAVCFIGGRQRAVAGMLHMATHRALWIGAVAELPRRPIWRLREVDAILRRDPVYAALPRLGGTLGGLDEIYRSPPLRRDQADTALVGAGA